MAKFKKGDRVKVLHETDGWGEIRKGAVGTIVRRLDYHYSKDDSGIGYEVNFSSQSDWVGGESCFELVEAQVPKVKVIKEDITMAIKGMYAKIEKHLSNELILDCMEDVLLGGLEAKAKLNALLGHTADNDYRTVLELPMSEFDWTEGSFSNDRLRKAVLECFPCTDLSCHTNSITLNGSTQAQRLTRVITKDLAKFRDAHPFRDFLKGEFSEWTEEQYGAKLGEKFVSNATRVAVISTNFFDFLTASGQHWKLASFSSCHNWGGCHYNGNFSYINDEMSLICYIAPKNNLDYKEGRSWMYIPSGLDCIVQPKSYGTFTDVQRKFCREYMEKRLAAHHGWDAPSKWVGRSVNHYNNSTGSTAAYFDNSNVRFVYPSEHRPDFKDNEPRLQFALATCPSCGKDHSNTEDGVCYDCNGKGTSYECYNCHGMFDEDDGHHDSDGDFYCSDCYHDAYTSCHHCGTELFREGDAAHWVESEDEYYCTRHYEQFFFWCDECQEDHRISERVEYNGDSICKGCADDMDIVKCEDCGEYVDREDLIEIVDTGEFVCEDCADNWYPCKECGDVNSEWADADNQLCCKCAEANPVEDEAVAAVVEAITVSPAPVVDTYYDTVVAEVAMEKADSPVFTTYNYPVDNIIALAA